VMSGVARRAWARNENALSVAADFNRERVGNEQITLPYLVDDEIIRRAVKTVIKE